MEDVVKALYIAFAVLILVIALTVSMNLFTQARQTADVIVFTIDESNYYDNLKANDNNIERIVGIETVIPTLYRYYKENFLVRILDSAGKEIQVFDTELEASVRAAANVNMARLEAEAASETDANQRIMLQNRIKTYKAHRELYNNPALATYMFGAPWIGSTTEDARARIDYFLYGKIGYINGTELNYSSGSTNLASTLSGSTSFFEKYKNTKFKETFIEYEYTGKTITSDDGEVTLEEEDTKTKIQITYQIMP